MTGSGLHISEWKRGRGRIEGSTRSTDRTFLSAYVKWLTFSFNLFFWVVSWTVIAIGIWAFYESQSYRTRSGQEIDGVFDILFNVSLAFILLGVVMFIIAFFGTNGALVENITFLKIYFSLIIFIMMLEVGAVIALFALPETARGKIESLFIEEAIQEYRSDVDRTNLVDWFQETFECCGLGEETPWRVWEANLYFNCSSPGFEACSVPYSCCKYPYTFDSDTINSRCGAGMLNSQLSRADVSSKIHTTGCYKAATVALQNNLLTIGGIGLAILLPQFLGIFLSRVLWGQIKTQRNRGIECKP